MDKICKTILTQIPDFIEGKLNDSEHRVVQEHIRGCAACRNEENDLRATIVSLPRRESYPRLPESYWATIIPRIHEKIDKQQHGFRLFPGWIYRIVFPVAAVILVVVFVYRSGVFFPESPENNLLVSIQQLSTDERKAVIDEYPGIFPDAVDEYVTLDSIPQPLQSAAVEVARTGSPEYIYENQLEPETLLESLSPEEIDRVVTRLQKQKFITS